MIFVVLIATCCLPIGVAHARVQNISITKLIDEPYYKETLFVIITSEDTYHILVTANITVVGNETLINLTATLINPHNVTILASATIPDTLTDHPYIGVVKAIHFHFLEEVVEYLVYWILPIVIIATIIIQVYMILEEISEYLLSVLLNQAPFVWASIPYVLYTLLRTDSNDDDTGTHTPYGYPPDHYHLGSFDFYIPYLPFWYHVGLVLDGHYYVATSKSWWEIEEHEVYTDVWTPWGVYRIVWFTCYDAHWICSRIPPSPPEKPPSALFYWTPIKPIAGEEVVFTSTSFDPDGFITTHQWWLGDGDQRTTKTFRYIYNTAGSYNVTLKVTDNDDLTSNITQTVNVQLAVTAKLRVIPDHLEISVQSGQYATTEFLAGESLNQTDLYGVAFQASDLKNPDNYTISSGNVTFNKNGITIPKGMYTNVTVTFHAPVSLPIGWYNGNITASSENGGNSTIYVDLRITSPFYELTVASSPISGVTYTINGSKRITPHSEILPEGSYVLEMPQTHNRYVWFHWLEDGDTSRIKTITLPGTTWTAVYVPAPPPPPVGGKAIPINIPMNNPELPNPLIWLSTIIVPLIATVVFIKLKKKKQ